MEHMRQPCFFFFSFFFNLSLQQQQQHPAFLKFLLLRSCVFETRVQPCIYRRPALLSLLAIRAAVPSGTVPHILGVSPVLFCFVLVPLKRGIGVRSRAHVRDSCALPWVFWRIMDALFLEQA